MRRDLVAPKALVPFVHSCEKKPILSNEIQTLCGAEGACVFASK